MVRVARFFVIALAALLAARALLWQAAWAAPSPTDASQVRAEIDRVYDWAGYQRDLPTEKPRRPPPSRPLLSIDLGSLTDILLFGLVVIAVVAVALWLRSSGWNPLTSGGPAAPPDEATATVATAPSKTRLREADQSAGSGDWANAIHILLLTSIELLRRRLGQDVPPAMTARARVGRAQVAEQARADFAALVRAAELCHFGGRPADRSLYERCRLHYERLWDMPPEQPA